jgi:radical SAM superfamily enzyme YgiQ (UPF0313 family)
MTADFDTAGAHAPEPPPYRPPSEADSVLIRVTRGCSWNRCTFCGMYKDTRFSPRPQSEIMADIATLKQSHGETASVFLGDADSLLHRDILEIIRAVKTAFPTAERITSYSRLTTLRKHKPAQLALLRQAGLTRIHAGLESGLAQLLTTLRKGHTPQQAIDGGCQAINAGFELCLYQLVGVAGEDDSQSHASESARVISEIHPHHLRLRSYVPLPSTPLGDRHHGGELVPISPLTRLREIRTLLSELTPRDTVRSLVISSDHFSNYVWADSQRIFEGVFGQLPLDRDRMLSELDQVITRAGDCDRLSDPAQMALAGRLFGL